MKCNAVVGSVAGRNLVSSDQISENFLAARLAIKMRTVASREVTQAPEWFEFSARDGIGQSPLEPTNRTGANAAENGPVFHGLF